MLHNSNLFLQKSVCPPEETLSTQHVKAAFLAYEVDRQQDTAATHSFREMAQQKHHRLQSQQKRCEPFALFPLPIENFQFAELQVYLDGQTMSDGQ